MIKQKIDIINSDFSRERERERLSASFALPKLIQAYLACRRHKRPTINALRFEVHSEHELINLQRQLYNRTYQPGRSVYFVITHPKPREVFAAGFRDRVIHHLLVNAIGPKLETKFIYDSHACRPGKGTLHAASRLRLFLRKITANGSSPAFFGQFDVKSFFTSIDKNILLEVLSREINRSFPADRAGDLLWLTKTIIQHNPTKNYYYKGDSNLRHLIPPHKTLFNAAPDKGLPIGNLTSQFFANVYLNELDQFIKRTLKIKFYLRYVDDIIVLSKYPSQIQYWRSVIDEFLQHKLALTLHPDKDKVGSVYTGIDFVGYMLKPDYLLSRRRVVKSLKTKLHFFNQGILLTNNNQKQMALPLSNPLTAKQLQAITATVNSYYGHFRPAACYRLRQNLYANHFGVLKQYLKPTSDYKYFTPHDNNS